MLPPTIANTADRERGGLEAARNDLTEEHLNPLYLDALRDPAGDPRAGCTDVLPSLPRPLRVRPRGAGRPVPRAARLDERLYEDSMDGPARACRHRPRRDGALGRTPLLPRLRDEAFPADRMLPALRGTLAGLGIDLDSQRTSTSTSRSGRTRPPAPSAHRSRSPSGHARGSSPRAGPTTGTRSSTRRAHRAPSPTPTRPEDGGEAARRQRGHGGLGDALRPPDRRPRLALEHAQLPPARGLRRRGGGPAPLLRAPLLRASCCTSSSSTPRRTWGRCGAAMSRSWATRSRWSRARRTTSPTSTPAST